MQLTGQKRVLTGKKSASLRAERFIPAVIFGKGLESTSVTVGYNEFTKMFAQTGETSVFDLIIEGKKHPVLVKEIQYHHINNQPIHVSFYQVNLKEKLKAAVPVELINEAENPLVKAGEALILVLHNEVEVEALPNDLPHKFVIDALKLVDMDTDIKASNLDYDRSKVELTDLKEDDVIAKLDYAVMQEAAVEEKTEEELMNAVEATKEKVAEDEEEGAKDDE
ncbi:50S ribosomal protein L25 [Patescibacteria group bacterium]|nr:50S ribosomal protein L25 [Patescibacteria group bacterium]